MSIVPLATCGTGRDKLKCKTVIKKKKDEKYDEKMFGYSTGRVIWVYS